MFNKITDYYWVVPFKVVPLFQQLEHFVNAAELQTQRIDRVKKLISKNVGRLHNYSFDLHKIHFIKLFSDAHFYFICIGQIHRLLEQINLELNNSSMNTLKGKFNSLFSKEIRDHLEHIDERALGKMKGKSVTPAMKKKWMSDFLNFSGNKLTFGGVGYEISNDRLEELKEIYKEFISIIHNDYAMKNENFIEQQLGLRRMKKLKKLARNFNVE
jgi:hypothetical protein